MQLARFHARGDLPAFGFVEGEQLLQPTAPDKPRSLAELLESADLRSHCERLLAGPTRRRSLAEVALLPPIDQQEVWAAGVTYRRSQSARMEESQGAASFYDLVYAADRPELFFKATPHRVCGTGQPLRIRRDAAWNVPEPELALVMNSRLELVAFTVGNDMSSRDIEGENPLYLPQAKLYNECCGLGPWMTLAHAMPAPAAIGIHLTIRRAGSIAFEGHTSVAQMARSFDDLIGWLGRDNSFPNGVVLLTGTGIVPTSEFTLAANDVVEITIDGIGTLSNPIVQG
jgi:2-dehydro-3-deoxy-D-arabinonate dehydratase